MRLQVMWPTRLVLGSHQEVCQLLEAILAGSNVVVCGSFQQAPLGWVYLIQIDAAPFVQRIEPDMSHSNFELWCQDCPDVSAHGEQSAQSCAT